MDILREASSRNTSITCTIRRYEEYNLRKLQGEIQSGNGVLCSPQTEKMPNYQITRGDGSKWVMNGTHGRPGARGDAVETGRSCGSHKPHEIRHGHKTHDSGEPPGVPEVWLLLGPYDR